MATGNPTADVIFHHAPHSVLYVQPYTVLQQNAIVPQLMHCPPFNRKANAPNRDGSFLGGFISEHDRPLLQVMRATHVHFIATASEIRAHSVCFDTAGLLGALYSFSSLLQLLALLFLAFWAVTQMQASDAILRMNSASARAHTNTHTRARARAHHIVP
jgi:hypothetical protein